MIYEGRNINVTLLFARRGLRAGRRGLHPRPRAPPRGGQDARRRTRSPRSSSRASTPRSTSASRALGRRRPARARPGIANARAAYRRFKEIFHGERFAALRDGRRAGAAPAVGLDRREEPRLPRTCTSTGWSGPTPSTRCRWRRCWPPPTTPRSRGADRRDRPGAGPAGAGRGRHRPGRRHRRSCCARASTSSSSRSRSCSTASTSKREAIVTARPPTIEPSIPDELEPRDRARASSRRPRTTSRGASGGRTRRSGARPAQPEIADRLGWLTIAEPMREAARRPRGLRRRGARRGHHRRRAARHGRLVARARGDPPQLRRRRTAWPALHVLDSTDAGAIRAVEAAIDLDKTLFLVSTKSGGTIETLSLFKHFWSRRAGRPRTSSPSPTRAPGLEELAREHGFRRTFLNDPDIGGRYSALSYFGLVPAALMGADIAALLRPRRRRRAELPELRRPATATAGCGSGSRSASWPQAGRDKLTYVVDPPLAELRALGRAADRRVDRQARQGDRAGRRRAARRRPTSTATTASSSTCATRTRPTRRPTPGRGARARPATR